jgi:hypothetical protein
MSGASWTGGGAAGAAEGKEAAAARMTVGAVAAGEELATAVGRAGAGCGGKAAVEATIFGEAVGPHGRGAC